MASNTVKFNKISIVLNCAYEIYYEVYFTDFEEKMHNSSQHVQLTLVTAIKIKINVDPSTSSVLAMPSMTFHLIITT